MQKYNFIQRFIATFSSVLDSILLHFFQCFPEINMSASPGGSHDQEFQVRIPARSDKKNYHVMKFNQSLNMDTAKWTQVRILPGLS